MRKVAVAAPVEAFELELEPVRAARQCGEDFLTRGDDFLANAIAWNDCNPMFAHELALSLPAIQAA